MSSNGVINRAIFLINIRKNGEVDMTTTHDSDLLAALKARQATRAEVRQRLESNSAAIALAEQAAADAAATLRQAKQNSLDMESENAAMAAATFLAGGRDIGPITDDEKIMLAKVSALGRQTACAGALVKLREARVKIQEELRSADTAVVKIVDTILDDEREALAAEIERRYSELVGLVENLRSTVPDPMFLPANIAVDTSPTIAAALNRLPPPDDLHTPVNVLRYGRHAKNDAWVARRAALIAGETIPTDDSKAA
jgi:hypothetical protein